MSLHPKTTVIELTTATLTKPQAVAILGLLERHCAELPDHDRLGILAIIRAAAHGVSASPAREVTP